jgi:hypothetical protein
MVRIVYRGPRLPKSINTWQAVTAQMVSNMLTGGAAVSIMLARQRFTHCMWWTLVWRMTTILR